MTRKNRRDYYRVLHVQPDAPIEVIKAGYRTLMRTLKRHPGGSVDAHQRQSRETPWRAGAGRQPPHHAGELSHLSGNGFFSALSASLVPFVDENVCPHPAHR